jgi:hypothetical protein
MEKNARYRLPSRNACYVDPTEMPELLRPKNIPNRHGVNRMVQEGFMIRQSFIKDGKVTIPAGGLIYFENGGEYFGPLNGEPATIAGEDAVWIDIEETLAVKKDFFLPFGGQPVPLGEEGTIALKPGGYLDSYFGERVAAMKFVFANGHPGWDKQVVLQDTEHGKSKSSVSSGYVDKEGMITPPPIQYFGDPFDAFHSTYVLVDDVAPNGIHIKEAGAPEVNWFKISYTRPTVVDNVSMGETAPAGKYTVKVLACDADAGTVNVALMDSSGEILAEKILGPLTLETYKIKNFIHQNKTIRDSMSLDYDDVRVQLNTKYDTQLLDHGPTNIFDETGKTVPVTEAKNLATFQEDGVSLVIYTDIEKVPLRKPWAKDPKFVFQTHYI